VVEYSNGMKVLRGDHDNLCTVVVKISATWVGDGREDPSTSSGYGDPGRRSRAAHRHRGTGDEIESGDRRCDLLKVD